jgi:hypothetical protein
MLCPLIPASHQNQFLESLEFVANAEEVVVVPDLQSVTLQQYADDMQLYMTSKPADVSSVRSILADCVDRINTPCSSRRLLLHAKKTELIWFGSRANLNKIAKIA